MGKGSGRGEPFRERVIEVRSLGKNGSAITAVDALVRTRELGREEAREGVTQKKKNHAVGMRKEN